MYHNLSTLGDIQLISAFYGLNKHLSQFINYIYFTMAVIPDLGCDNPCSRKGVYPFEKEKNRQGHFHVNGRLKDRSAWGASNCGGEAKGFPSDFFP